MSIHQRYLKLVQATLPLLEEAPHILASLEDAAFFRQATAKKNTPEPARKLPAPEKSVVLNQFARGPSAPPRRLLDSEPEIYPNNLKNRFLSASVLPQNSCLHSHLASGQWPFAPDKNFEEPPCQNPDSSSCLGIAQSLPARSPVEIKEKPSVKNIFSSSFFSLFSKIAPEMALLKEIPDDAMAKKIALRWKTKNQTAPITLLTFSEPEPHQKFLENIVKALDVYFGSAKLVSAETIEKEKEWGAFLEAEGLKLIIVCDYTLWQLRGLMHFYKEVPNEATRTLGKIPLFLLPDLSLYLKDPLLKRSLWKALCQKNL